MSPTKGDADAGDCVVAFRIYQSASATVTPLYTDRLVHTQNGVNSTAPCTSTAQTSYTTLGVGSSSASLNKVFITSVDSHLNESTPVAATVPTYPP
jgi:hypothetical protein